MSFLQQIKKAAKEPCKSSIDMLRKSQKIMPKYGAYLAQQDTLGKERGHSGSEAGEGVWGTTKRPPGNTE